MRRHVWVASLVKQGEFQCCNCFITKADGMDAEGCPVGRPKLKLVLPSDKDRE